MNIPEDLKYDAVDDAEDDALCDAHAERTPIISSSHFRAAVIGLTTGHNNY